MITITDAITIAIITIAITIAIITISPGPSVPTYADNPWEASSRFHWKILVGDLLSPRFNCLPFLQNLGLQLSTPCLWGIVRFRLGGRAKDKVQTMISTDLMISATVHRPSSVTHHMPHATCQTLCTIRHPPHASLCLASSTQQVSGSSMQQRTSEHIDKWDWECLPSGECTCEQLGGILGCILRGVLGSVLEAYLGVYSQVGWECDWERLESVLGSVQSNRLRVRHRVQLGVYLRACSGVLLRASRKHTWERTVQHDGSVPSSAIGSVLESMLGSVLENVLRADLGVYSQEGYERDMKCNWECTWERARECDWERLERVLGSV